MSVEEINVLMLMKDSCLGGVSSCVASLADGLKKYKNADTIIGTSDGEAVGTVLKDNINIIDFGSKNIFTIIKNYKIIKNLIREKKINIIHAQNRIPAFYAAFYCFFHKEMEYIWSNHLVPLPSDFIHRKLTLYGSCAVAEGITGREMLINNFRINPKKVEAVNLGTDFSMLKRTSNAEQDVIKHEYDIHDDEKIILLYGRLHPIKGHDFLLDSLKNLSEEKFKLVFPGKDDEYKQHIIEKAKTIGVDDKIIFPGYVNGNEWLSIADLMVLPSQKEGFGIVNIESFAMEVPVIRTKTGGYEDMKDLCFGVEFGDTKGLEELLRLFFENDSRFERIKHIAKKECYRFSLESYTNGYYEIYKKVLGR